jgi:hypothetical protein
MKTEFRNACCLMIQYREQCSILVVLMTFKYSTIFMFYTRIRPEYWWIVAQNKRSWNDAIYSNIDLMLKEG